MASVTRKTPAPKVRFREREDLLDFLLEVANIAAETLDLDKLLAEIPADKLPK